MSVLVYCAEINLKKNNYSGNNIPEIGFIWSGSAGDYGRLLWCESNVNTSFHVPIIIEVSDIESSLDIECPVVQYSGVTIRVSNHDKIILKLKDIGIGLQGQPIQITLKKFDEAGEETQSTIMFSGEIQGMTMDDTEIELSCESNLYNRKSQVLKENELFTVGESSDTSLFAINRIAPFKEVLKFTADSFLVVGRNTLITTYPDSLRPKRSYYYYVLFRTQPLPDEEMMDYGETFDALIGSWMYVVSGGGDSKGQYRKVLSAVRVHGYDIESAYMGNLYYDNFMEFDITDPNDNTPNNWYFKIEVDGMFTAPLKDDLLTYVQFININFDYTISKETVSQAPTKLFIKDKNDKYSEIPVVAGNELLITKALIDEQNKLSLTVKRIADENTIITYTMLPCYGLQIINDSTLGRWQFIKPDDTLYGKFYKLQSENGFYYHHFDGDVGEEIADQTDFSFTNPGYVFDWILDGTHYARFYHKFRCSMHTVVALEYSLPDVNDDFTFKNAYLGMVIESKCSKGVTDPPIKVLSRTRFGEAVEVVSIPLLQWVNNGVIGGVISDIPHWYYSTYSPMSEYFSEDFEEDYSATTEATDKPRFTNYKKFKLNCETVEEYRRIYKIGLFFPRGATSSYVEDEIKIHELCVIFEHENEMKEVYI
jgi:hypothetical protein